MITAREARIKTKDVINKCLTKELSQINELIQEAISEGEFEIHNEGTLSETTRKALEENGYTIKTGSQYNESYYFIKW